MKKLLTAGLLFAACSSLTALDWGLSVTEVPLVMAGPTNLFVESLKVTPFVSQPLWGTDFRAQGEGAWSASTDGKTWTLSDPSFDLTELSLKGGGPLESGAWGVVEWDLGRRSVSDSSGGWILGSRWDGASLSWSKGAVSYTGALGYSGLLTKKAARLAVSEADEADQTDPQVTMAPSRVYAAAGWGQNEVFLRQDFQTEVLGNLDLRSGAKAVHTAYLTAQLSGPLFGGFRHRTFSTANLNVAHDGLPISVLLGSEASASLPWMGSRVVVSGALALGGGERGFQPISGKGMADVVGLPSSHGAAAALDYSLKPLPRVTLGFKNAALFRTSSHAPVLSGFLPDTKQAWLGTESGLTASWNPTSEASFGANTGVFIPQSQAFEAGTPPSFLFVLTATLKL